MASTLSHGAPNVVHRWRRHILHIAACAAVIASGGLGVLVARPAATPEPVPVTNEAPAMNELALVPPLPVPAPAVPDAPRPPATPPVDTTALAVTPRTYMVQPGDSVRSIAQQF